MLRHWLVLTLFAAGQSGLAMAQQSTVAKGSSAGERKLAYESIFASYRAYKDQTPASWREVNQAVAPAVKGSDKPSAAVRGKGEKEQTPASSVAPHSEHH